jgi:hypothetical protein
MLLVSDARQRRGGEGGCGSVGRGWCWGVSGGVLCALSGVTSLSWSDERKLLEQRLRPIFDFAACSSLLSL